MKRCPQCGREYDTSMMFCLDDGTELLYGPGSSEGAPTEVFSTASVEDAPTKVLAAGKQPAAYADEGFWIAVLPFDHATADSDLAALADGLNEDITMGLSRFSYLRVIARSTTLSLGKERSDAGSMGRKLGASYLIEGTLRRAGAALRLSVQLVDVSNGAHLWAEKYERNFDASSLFDLQDDLASRIVATVADVNGVLPRSMGARVRDRDPNQLSPYDAVLRSFGYSHRLTAESVADAISVLKRAVQEAPAYVDAWAVLAWMLTQDYGQGFGVEPDPLVQAAAAARKSVELGASAHLAWFSLAQVHFFEKQLERFRYAAERAVELNPLDGHTIASLGELLTFAGDVDRGSELVERAKKLNPNHPGWYWYADFYREYRRANYQAARDFALKVNLPGHWAQPTLIAAACGQLGDTEAGRNAVRDLLALRPDAASTVVKDMAKWWEPAVVEHLVDGLRKAGMEIADPPLSRTE
jgi:adenylate cyclase